MTVLYFIVKKVIWQLAFDREFAVEGRRGFWDTKYRRNKKNLLYSLK